MAGNSVRQFLENITAAELLRKSIAFGLYTYTYVFSTSNLIILLQPKRRYSD
jgi:hypothetical protein